MTKIIVALDGMKKKMALSLADILKNEGVIFKAGALLDKTHPVDLTELLKMRGGVCVDVKFFDIPGAICERVKTYASHGIYAPDFITVHAAGGLKMMKEAVKAAKTGGHTKILAVTVLSSWSEQDCRSIYKMDIAVAVAMFARRAIEAGCCGIVCAVPALNYLNQFGNEFKNLLKVCPAIRPAWCEVKNDDQSPDQIAGVQEAVEAGADYLVIGRPITMAKDPLAALKRIQEEISFMR